MRRRMRTASWVLAVLVVIWLAATARLFVWPPTDEVHRADAVIMLPGESTRLPRALQLVEGGVSSTLVISTGPNDAMEEAGLTCGRNGHLEVLCFQPQPATTSGEARGISRLADEHGWNRIAVVTSRYHITRAAVLIRQCFDGELRMVAARSPLGPMLGGMAPEWPSLIAAYTVDRAC